MVPNLVFISAGGRGTRLWKELPELKKSALPKSLGIIIKERPLIAYQLDKLVKLPDVQIVLTFNDKRSIKVFKNYIKKTKIPTFDYFYTLTPYRTSNDTTIDVLRASFPHKPWADKFGFIVITSGDVFFDSNHIFNMLNTWKKYKCSVKTLSDFHKYQISLKHHFHPIYYKSGWLKGIMKSDEVPKKILSHPQFLTEKAFRIYCAMPKDTSKSEFVREAIQKGQKFKVEKPKEYVNVNYPQDYDRLLKYIN